MFNTRLKNKIQQLEKRLAALEHVKATLDQETVAVTLDAVGVIVQANAMFEKELGFTHAELVGRPLRELSPHELSSDVHQHYALNAIAKGSHYSGTLRLSSRLGSQVWLRVMVIPFSRDDGPLERISLYSSVLTRTIETSRENEALVGALMRSTAMIAFTLGGIVLTANESFLESMGYTLAQIEGQHHRMFCLPSDAQSAQYEKFCRPYAPDRLSRVDFVE